MGRRSIHLLDRVAIGLSGLCVVHCLVGVLLISLFAIGGDWFDHRVHVVGLALALPLAALAFWRGWQRHRQAGICLLGAVGLAVMLASLAVTHGDLAEMLVSMVGVVLLALAHWQNMRALARH